MAIRVESARVNVVVLSGQISAQVFNPFLRPIVCSGQVYGQTIAGPVLTTYFTNQIIYPGTDRVMLVQALITNPFVGGRADVFCGFIY